MEFTNLETGNVLIVNDNLEIKLPNFSTSTNKVQIKTSKEYYDFTIDFSVLLYPNGVDKNTEGWLVISPNVGVRYGIYGSSYGILSWIVNIIDIEGNFRFPRSFEILSDLINIYAKYFERSFIFNRASELLPDGVLTLQCDIYFKPKSLPIMWFPWRHGDINCRQYVDEYFNSIPHSLGLKKGDGTGDSCVTHSVTVFDFTNQILTLPQFHDLRKSYGVYGIPPMLSSVSLEPNKDYIDVFENIWILDTTFDRFLLSLDERHDSVGFRLINESPVIRRCVNTPMKEQRSKCITFTNVGSQTLRIVLFVLANGMFPISKFDELVDVYKMSHLYEMRDIQRKCAEHMVMDFELTVYYRRLKEIVYFFTDGYLSLLLDTCCREYAINGWDHPQQNIDYRPDSDCYV